jgi:hypothetical protein
MIDQKLKSVIMAFKHVKKDHKRLYDLIVEFIEDGKADPDLIHRAAAEISKLNKEEISWDDL